MIGLVVALMLGQISVCAQLDQWSLRNPLPTSQDFASVVYALNRFTAVTKSGTVWLSTSGLNWSVQKAAKAENFSKIIYVKDMFVGVGHGISTSDDGLNWIKRYDIETPGNSSPYLFSIASGNGVIAALGRSRVLASTNGIDWEIHPLPLGVGSGVYAFGIAFGKGTFAVTAIQNGTSPHEPPPPFMILTSTNLVDWNTHQLTATWAAAAPIAFGGGRFVTIPNGRPHVSTDGETWIGGKTLQPTAGFVYQIMHENDVYVAVCEQERIYTSSDAFTWTLAHGPGDHDLYDVVHGSNTWVTVGAYGGILASRTTTTWKPAYKGSLQINGGIAFGKGVFVVAGGTSGLGGSEDPSSASPSILSSLDGKEWSQFLVPQADLLWKAAYGNGVFVVTGRGPKGTVVLTSTNGTSWNLYNPLLGVDLTRLRFVNGQFRYVGSLYFNNTGMSAIASSEDGVTWSTTTLEEEGGVSDIAYGNGLWVAISSTYMNSTAFVSRDGKIWTRHPMPGDWRSCALTFGKGRFYAFKAMQGGEGIYSSADGSQWLPINGTEDWTFADAIYKNETFVATGWYGLIWVSSDGINWSNRYGGPLANFFGLGYGQNSFWAVGSAGTIVQSGYLPSHLNIEQSGSGLMMVSPDEIPIGTALETSQDLLEWQHVSNIESVRESVEIPFSKEKDHSFFRLKF
jgi:hypothetical protein